MGYTTGHIIYSPRVSSQVPARVVDAVTVFVGGKSGKGARLAEKIMEDVPCDQLSSVLEPLVQYYPRKSAS